MHTTDENRHMTTTHVVFKHCQGLVHMQRVMDSVRLQVQFLDVNVSASIMPPCSTNNLAALYNHTHAIRQPFIPVLLYYT